MARCDGCLSDVETVVEGLCPKCRGTLGMLLSQLPVQRPAGPCTRCGGSEIIQALLRERGAGGGDYVSAFLRPLAVAHDVTDQKTFWTERKVGVSPDLESYFGALVAYVCRACGHAEFFAVAPSKIPIGALHGTRLLVYESSPYR